jgi:hypothetical protein
MKIILTDAFNGRKISSHRTVEKAIKARDAHLRAIKKSNGSSSYLTYSITADNGQDISAQIAEISSRL